MGADQRFDNYEGGGEFCFFLKGLEEGRRGMLYLNFFLSEFVNLYYSVNQGSSTQVPLLHCSVLCLSLRSKIQLHQRTPFHQCYLRSFDVTEQGRGD